MTVGQQPVGLPEEVVRALQVVEEASRELRPLPAHLKELEDEGDEEPAGAGDAVASAQVGLASKAREEAAKRLFIAADADSYFAELASPGVLACQHVGQGGSGATDAHQDRLQKWLSKVDFWVAESHTLTSDISTLHKKLGSLVEINNAVKQQSTFLSNKASALITNSEDCQNLCQGIELRLKHFATVDRLSNEFMGTPDPKSKRFKQLLTEMDATLQFLSSNSDFKSATQYLARMHATQQKALGILRDTIISSVQGVTQSVSQDPRFLTILERTQSKRQWPGFSRTASNLSQAEQGSSQQGDRQSSDASGQGGVGAPAASPDELNSSGTVAPGTFGLGSILSIEFRGRLHETAPLLASLSDRCAASESYKVFFQDVQDAYVQARLSLLSPIFADYMAPHMSKQVASRDLAGMVAHGTTYLLAMAADEMELYNHLWKKSPNLAVPKQIVDSVSLVLYDSFRSTVLGEDDMGSLCNIIHTLNNSVLSRLQASGEAGQLIARTLSHMCQDAQERLIFRASMHVKDTITPFTSTQAECLKYTQPFGVKRQEVGEEAGSLVQADPRLEYFPALQNTLGLLSSLYNVVDKGVFSVLAQEALKACTYNLMQVAQCIKGVVRTTLPTAELDSRLFLVKHLLQLREQISPFEVNFQVVEKHVDLTNIRLNEISVAATQHDTKKELEQQLKQVCEQFISVASHYAGASIVRFSKLLKERAKDPLGATESLGQILESVLTNIAKGTNEQAGGGGTPQTGTPATAPLQPAAQEGAAPAAEAAAAQAEGGTADAQSKGQAKLSQAMQEFKLVITRFEEAMPALLTKMQFYLSNQFTMGILFNPVKRNLVEAYGEMHTSLGTYVNAVVSAADLPGDAATSFMAETWEPARMVKYMKNFEPSA